MTFHVCVWIDQREAKIFELTATEVAASHVEDGRPNHHIHRKADHVDKGTVQMDPHLLGDVAAKLKAAKGILIVGPGKAKTVLKTYLDDHHPEVAKYVWDVQASDHPSDAQLVASARSWFHAQDRMR